MFLTCEFQSNDECIFFQVQYCIQRDQSDFQTISQTNSYQLKMKDHIRGTRQTKIVLQMYHWQKQIFAILFLGLLVIMV